MTQVGARPKQINIHLTIHKSQEDVHVDFLFDMETENIDEVVSALVETLKLTEGDKESIKGLMVEQIESMGYSVDEGIDDPDYAKLLEEQRQELAEMEKRHAAEQDELLKRLMGTEVSEDLLIFNS